jgi:hypothetical protein
MPSRGDYKCEEARENERGLWGSTLTPVPLSPTPVPPPPTEPPSQNCDPSCPDVCIPPPPPDLDCGDIPYRNFRVVGSPPIGSTGIMMGLAVRVRRRGQVGGTKAQRLQLRGIVPTTRHAVWGQWAG